MKKTLRISSGSIHATIEGLHPEYAINELTAIGAYIHTVDIKHAQGFIEIKPNENICNKALSIINNGTGWMWE